MARPNLANVRKNNTEDRGSAESPRLSNAKLRDHFPLELIGYCSVVSEASFIRIIMITFCGVDVTLFLTASFYGAELAAARVARESF